VEQIVENGVDLSLWQKIARPARSKDEPVRFIFAGRLESWKGGRLAIGALREVLQTCPATLDVIGDGETRQTMEEQVRSLGLSDSVRFLGWMPQEQVAKRFAESDVFVLPSYFECGGAVVLEAMACGLPVIAMNWGGPADYVTPESGILLDPQPEPRFIQSMAKAMCQLAQNPELRSSMGEAGRARVEAFFDWERKIDQILDAYGRAMKGQ
jgi:glycosyltransferase involved in cell wall biosynthesis